MKRRLLFLLTCLTLITGVAMAKTVKGIVVDASDKEPIIGASVLIKGTTNGTTTNIDGEFTLNAPDNATALIVSYVGMTTREVAITDGKMTIELSSSSQDLDEVIVVAYGAQKKSSITGAISQVNAKDIETRPVSSVTAALEGATSGITVMSNYGQPGSSPSIQIRGVGTVNGSNSPLYVVDGVPYDSSITDLNPEDIESMSVLKDAASCALYGNRASNGVILVTTKKSKVKRPSFTFKTNQGFYKRGIPEYDRVNVAQFMDVEYQNMFNNKISSEGLDRYNAADRATAHDFVKKNIVKDLLILNPFDAADDALYDDNGHFVGAKMKGTYGEDLDWFDQGIRTGYRAEYLFSGSGGTDFSDYYFSVGYLDENGYMKDSGFSRLSGRAVINITPKKWFKAGVTLNATHQKTDNSAGPASSDNSTSTTNPFYFSRYIAPIYPVHLHDGVTGEYMLNAEGKLQYDPGFYMYTDENGVVQEVSTRDQLSNNHAIWEGEVNSERTKRNTMNGTAYTNFILPYGFTVILKGNVNTVNTENSDYGSALIGGSAKGGAESGSLSKTIYNRKYWTLQQQLNWNYTFNRVHFVNVLVGHENYSMSRDYTYVSKKGVNIEGLAALKNFNTISTANGYRTKYRTESYLARVQYNYDDRYNVEASWRRDGSSRFAKDVRWGNFGSVGANWVFTNEEFMKDISWLNSGKFRVNWGQVGNDQGSDYYAYYGLYEVDTKGGAAAYYLSQLAASDLKWETGESWGIGLEARLFNRWNLSVEYYDKRNKDLIFDVYNPISAGGTSTSSAESTVTKNLGTISNRGFEINTDVTVFKNRDWTVNIAANLTTLKNKVLKLPEQNKDGIVSGSYKIVEGRSRYEYFTYHWAGVDMMDGQSLYEGIDETKYHIVAPDNTIVGGVYDADGTLTSTEIKAGEYKLINGKYYVNNTTYAKKNFCGSSLPKVYGSFTGNFAYKNFSLSAIFTYSLGGKLRDSSYSSLMSANKEARNYHVDLLNSWNGRPEGMTETSADRINPNINPEINYATSSYNNSSSDRWLISRNYIALKNLNFSYKLPKSILRACDLDGVILNFAAENLFTKTERKGLNAQQYLSGGVYNSLPPARVFTFGITVNL